MVWRCARWRRCASWWWARASARVLTLVFEGPQARAGRRDQWNGWRCLAGGELRRGRLVQRRVRHGGGAVCAGRVRGEYCLRAARGWWLSGEQLRHVACAWSGLRGAATRHAGNYASTPDVRRWRLREVGASCTELCDASRRVRLCARVGLSMCWRGRATGVVVALCAPTVAVARSVGGDARVCARRWVRRTRKARGVGRDVRMRHFVGARCVCKGAPRGGELAGEVALFGATLLTFVRARGTETEAAREAAESSDARDGGASDAPFVCGASRGVVPHSGRRDQLRDSLAMRAKSRDSSPGFARSRRWVW